MSDSWQVKHIGDYLSSCCKKSAVKELLVFIQWLDNVITSVYVTHISFPSVLLPQSHQMVSATPTIKFLLKVERRKGQAPAISSFHQEKHKLSQSPGKYLLYSLVKIL